MGKRTMVEFRGRTQNLSVWAAELGLNYGTVLARIHGGMSPQAALSSPPRPGRRPNPVNGTAAPAPARANSDPYPTLPVVSPVLTASQKFHPDAPPTRLEEPARVAIVPIGLQACAESEALEMTGGLLLGIAARDPAPDAFAPGSDVTFLRPFRGPEKKAPVVERPTPTDGRISLLEDLLDVDRQLSRLTADRARLLAALS